MIAETEPFGSDENGEKEEEEGVVEICVPDHGSTHNRKGEANVEEKDATTGWLCVGPVTAGWEGVGGECVVLVNGKVRSCHGKGRQRGFYCWWRQYGFCCWWWISTLCLIRSCRSQLGFRPRRFCHGWVRL